MPFILHMEEAVLSGEIHLVKNAYANLMHVQTVKIFSELQIVGLLMHWK